MYIQSRFSFKTAYLTIIYDVHTPPVFYFAILHARPTRRSIGAGAMGFRLPLPLTGLRSAPVGAKPMSIMKLIVVESVAITAFFGYIGMVIGMIADYFLDKTIGSHPMDIGFMQMYIFKDIGVGFDVALKATRLLIVAGTIAGIIPAWKGAKVRPIEALRAER